MQDKHIDELPKWVCMGENLMDLDKSDPMHLTLTTECKKHPFSGGCSLPEKDLQALITNEQIAIWNKALELVGDYQPTEFLDLPEDKFPTTDNRALGRNELRAELRSAIQQHIDRIGGGDAK